MLHANLHSLVKTLWPVPCIWNMCIWFFLRLPAAGAAHWVLLSRACTADSRRNGWRDEKRVGCRLLPFLPSGLPFTCSSPMYHARAICVSLNSEVNNLAILIELLKQIAHVFTIL